MIDRELLENTAYVDGPNLYQYVRSNPLSKVDPFGLEAFDLGPIPAACDVKIVCKSEIKFGVGWAGPKLTITDTETGETWSGKVDWRNGADLQLGPCTVTVKCFTDIDFDKEPCCRDMCRKKCKNRPGMVMRSKCRVRCFRRCIKR